MQQGQLAQRRLHHAVMPALPTAQLTSLRGTLQTLALTGWHALVTPLHRSRSKEAARVLRRCRDLATANRAGRETLIP
jgi:hypothetical protein